MEQIRSKTVLPKHCHGHGHYHVHDVYEKEYGEQESNWHGEPDLLFTFEKTYALCFCDINGFSVLCLSGTLYTHGGVSGQPESLSHPGEANFQAPPKIVPPGTKDFSLSLRIIPNVLNLSHYEMPFMDTRGHILWRGT
uniref:Uncharacterized protein n=1 Tax=Brassica oleracea var. oleracea TaxID=109376 RepID=A0A0D3CA86_BRAOL